MVDLKKYKWEVPAENTVLRTQMLIFLPFIYLKNVLAKIIVHTLNSVFGERSVYESCYC
jgi:hypothetical protein